ncbi:MAG TPA: hypothetical protein VHO06_16005, partial [Polyangia bacterium]|nr:hypothetical protein [Polyangia bacterium]
ELERRRGEEADPTARAGAGICAAASGIALRNSQVVMADGLALGLAATALWLAARAVRTGHAVWLVPCSLAVAWGAVTRWQIVLIALPVATAFLLGRRDRAAAPDPPSRDGLWIAAAVLAGLLVLLPQLVVAHASTPAAFEHHEWLQRWNPLNAFRRDFFTTEGHARYHFPVALFYLLRLAWPDALFPTIAALALVGTWSLARRRRTLDIVLLVGWPVVNWAFISGIPYENPRFVWPALPAVAALAGFGFRDLAREVSKKRRSLLSALLVVSTAAGLAFAAREHGRTVAHKNSSRALVDWIDAVVPRGTTLLRFGGTMMAEYYGSTKVDDIYRLRPGDLPGLLARACPCDYLVRLPESDPFFEPLRRNPGLIPLASRPPFWMFAVRAPSGGGDTPSHQ